LLWWPKLPYAPPPHLLMPGSGPGEPAPAPLVYELYVAGIRALAAGDVKPAPDDIWDFVNDYAIALTGSITDYAEAADAATYYVLRDATGTGLVEPLLHKANKIVVAGDGIHVYTRRGKYTITPAGYDGYSNHIDWEKLALRVWLYGYSLWRKAAEPGATPGAPRTIRYPWKIRIDLLKCQEEYEWGVPDPLACAQLERQLVPIIIYR